MSVCMHPAGTTTTNATYPPLCWKRLKKKTKGSGASSNALLNRGHKYPQDSNHSSLITLPRTIADPLWTPQNYVSTPRYLPFLPVRARVRSPSTALDDRRLHHRRGTSSINDVNLAPLFISCLSASSSFVSNVQAKHSMLCYISKWVMRVILGLLLLFRWFLFVVAHLHMFKLPTETNKVVHCHCLCHGHCHRRRLCCTVHKQSAWCSVHHKTEVEAISVYQS